MALKTQKLTSKTKMKFKKKKGQPDLSKIDSVLTKPLESFAVKTYEDHGRELMVNDEIRKIINNYKANGVMFDPNSMGVPCYTPLGMHITNEETQRLKDHKNIIKIGRNFREDFFGIVHCVKKSYNDFYEDVDAMHRSSWLYLAIVNGLIKGYSEKNWQDFPVPSIVFHTDDPTFPGLLALMLNGEGQTPWGKFDFLRIHSNNARLHNSTATEDILAYQKVLSCINDGVSMPVPANHKDAKKLGASTHIEAIMQTDNMDKFRFIQSQNFKWWPMESRDSAIWGFYGNQFDHYVSYGLPMKGKAWDERDNDFHCIIQQVFGNLTNLREAVAPALKQLAILSKGSAKKSASDDAALSIVEIIYKDYYKGPHPVSGASGNYSWIDPNNKKVLNIVDGLMQIPNSEFAKKIKSL
jgi:hypothetical protein